MLLPSDSPRITCGRRIVHDQSPPGRVLREQVVLLQEVEVLVRMARRALARRDRHRRDVTAVRLRPLQQRHVLERAGLATPTGRAGWRNIRRFVSIWSRSRHPATSPGFSNNAAYTRCVTSACRRTTARHASASFRSTDTNVAPSQIWRKPPRQSRRPRTPAPRRSASRRCTRRHRTRRRRAPSRRLRA